MGNNWPHCCKNIMMILSECSLKPTPMCNIKAVCSFDKTASNNLLKGVDGMPYLGAGEISGRAPPSASCVPREYKQPTRTITIYDFENRQPHIQSIATKELQQLFFADHINSS